MIGRTRRRANVTASPTRTTRNAKGGETEKNPHTHQSFCPLNHICDNPVNMTSTSYRSRQQSSNGSLRGTQRFTKVCVSPDSVKRINSGTLTPTNTLCKADPPDNYHGGGTTRVPLHCGPSRPDTHLPSEHTLSPMMARCREDKGLCCAKQSDRSKYWTPGNLL